MDHNRKIRDMKKNLTIIKLKYSERGEYSYFTLPKGNLFDILLKSNINIGETTFTLYDIKVLISIRTKSKFDGGEDIVYLKDLIKVTDSNNNLL